MAAEILGRRRQRTAERRASMRPRRMAAEIRRAYAARDHLLTASMRPRRMAAEMWTSAPVGSSGTVLQ